MGLRTVLVLCDPGSWGQSWSQHINKFALWNFLVPFPFSLIFLFFLLLPRLPFFLPLGSVFLAKVSSSALEVFFGSFIHSFIQYLVSTYCVLGPVLDPIYKVNNTGYCPFDFNIC